MNFQKKWFQTNSLTATVVIFINENINSQWAGLWKTFNVNIIFVKVSIICVNVQSFVNQFLDYKKNCKRNEFSFRKFDSKPTHWQQLFSSSWKRIVTVNELACKKTFNTNLIFVNLCIFQLFVQLQG